MSAHRDVVAVVGITAGISLIAALSAMLLFSRDRTPDDGLLTLSRLTPGRRYHVWIVPPYRPLQEFTDEFVSYERRGEKEFATFKEHGIYRESGDVVIVTEASE